MDASQHPLAQIEEHLRLVIESSPAAMVIVDQEGSIVLVNEQTERWFGYTRDDLLGREVEILIPERYQARHREDRRSYLQQSHARPMGRGGELYARRKDGGEFPVDISLHPMEAEGGSLVMAHIVDISDRKLAEEAARRRAGLERLALLGQLAASVAHEIRNPLGVIRNAAYYLQINRQSLDADGQESVAEIEREVDRANHIVGELLDFARDSAGHAIPFCLNDVADSLAAKSYRPSGLKFRVEHVPPKVYVTADPDQSERILGNLLRNAVQAMPQGGLVTLRVFREGQFGVADVIDSGTGIRDEDRNRVFEPLFTTRATGIGLGLAVARRYAVANGGSLELVAHDGPGATFRLRLPLREARMRTQPPQPAVD